MNGIYLLLGSNIGNRLEYLREAEAHMHSKGIKVMEESSVYETDAWGKENQSAFLNVILQVETNLSPSDLLFQLLEIEKELGRIRKEKWGKRCIDIDILYFHDHVMETENLIVPHPGIPDRRFTLIPLAEVCPFEVHPLLNKTQMELLAECNDPLDCKLTDYKL